MSATKEQIEALDYSRTALYGWTALPRIIKSAPDTGPDWDIGADIRLVLDALTAAERERDEAVELLRRAWYPKKTDMPKEIYIDFANEVDKFLEVHPERSISSDCLDALAYATHGVVDDVKRG